jgi:uncharacterized protein (TIGR00730 family)
MNEQLSKVEMINSKPLHFNEDNGEIDRSIFDLFRLAGGIHHQKIIREMILAALKAGQENDEMGDLKLMNSTQKEMRYTSKVFGPYRHMRKVTVFGSARTSQSEPVYQMAYDLGNKLTEKDYMVITGGGPGIMQAINEGAGADHSFGVNIRLPFEQKSNHILEGSPRNIVYKYFFNRKVAFIKETDAVILFPGGFGTLDEAMEVLTLLQTGKCYPLPLILIDCPGGDYWPSWIKFLRDVLLPRGNIGVNDFYLFELVDSIDKAVEKIEHFYSRYHSIRYVLEKLVIRISSAISQHEVWILKDKYSDLLIPGGDLYLSGPLPEEQDEPELEHLSRLAMDFNKTDFGRFFQMIDAINRA